MPVSRKRKKKKNKNNFNRSKKNMKESNDINKGSTFVISTSDWSLEITLDEKTTRKLMSLPIDEFENGLKAIAAEAIEEKGLIIPPSGIDVQFGFDPSMLPFFSKYGDN